MNREQKTEFIEQMQQRFVAAPFVALTDFKGATVAQLDAVRRASEKAGVHFQVVKNTLSRRAVLGTEKEPLGPLFRGNIGVFFSSDDPIAAAKLVKDQAKANEKLVVRGGYFDGTLLDAKGTLDVATLPSREELFSTFLRTLQEGPRQVMGVIQGPARDLVYVLSNYANKLEDQG